MYDKLKKFSRDVSLERFKSHSLNNLVTIEEFDDKAELPANMWSCGIFWGNEDIRGLIVAKFTTLNILAMGTNVFENTNDNMLFTYTKDFMKEYCNLYAGFIKGTFNNHLIPIGISLPILSDSFEVGAALGVDAKDGLLDQWTLNSNESHFIVQSFIKIEDNFKKYNIDFITKNKSDEKKKSSIEFF